jgi:hypothetical protein
MKRIGWIMIVVMALLKTAPSFSQHTRTGFYMVIEDNSNCPNLAHTLTGEKMFCLPKDPVITQSEIENVGDVVSDKAKGQKFFDLRLSVAGFKTLTTLASKLPDSKVALVIGGHVSGIYECNGKINNRTLTVRGDFDSPDIEWMHEKVKKK